MFTYCISLEEIKIPSTVTVIDSNSFSYCESLKEITIPPSVVKIIKKSYNSFFCHFNLRFCFWIMYIFDRNINSTISKNPFSFYTSLKKNNTFKISKTDKKVNMIKIEF